MSKIYFTLTGTNHYFGKEFLKKGMKIRLEKGKRPIRGCIEISGCCM